MTRIYLSPPHAGAEELEFVREAFETNWLSTVGPNLNAFEQEMQAYIGRPCVALASGTAAIHLGLRLMGVGPGDEVLCPSFTFVASCNPITYLGATPIFLDSERTSWNLDPDSLEEAILSRMAAVGRAPKALIVVHLYGQTANMDRIRAVCNARGVAMFEDAAEGLGARHGDTAAGALAPLAAISFNGNKIITTSGGGMLIGEDPALLDKARFWSTQARDAGVAYEHSELGYNYRMSNVLAGMGRAQLARLDDRVATRRGIFERYREALQPLGLEPMPEAPWGRHTRWLSCFTVPRDGSISRDGILGALGADDIEARPAWKPMHLQPLFEAAPMFGGSVCEDLFARGLCLPSGSGMTESEQARVIDSLIRAVNR